ncbi:flavodoxin domain-containing protein [Dehalobacter sp.]|jgi:flavodoxin|uniref:flavodoxin family protein n=1 Tax=Dehalobacter sp. TaxID=1962289 RepID=UPI0003134537|nr:flavodoxin domain-containing protein [Dehalobacter sp.]MCG1025414.1 flavodoxin [Dehalobacter sp.]
MNIAVRYFTRGGKTKKVADAIAKAIGTEAQDCIAPLTEPVDLLFLGGAVYWGGIDKGLKQFIEQLDPAKTKCVAVFGTSAIKKEPDRDIEKLIQNKGIPVLNHSFHCRGEFSGAHKGHPDSNDLEQAAAFARTALKAMK